MTHNQGFTLIELLVVVAIIALLASVITPNVRDAWERSQATAAISQMRQIHNAVNAYVLDTGQLPEKCNPGCGPADDPLANDLGVPGWNGPYINLAEMRHPWGGRYSIVTDVDVHSNGFTAGVPDLIIYLDDDETPGDDAAPVPYEVLLMIDGMIDDGDLSSGSFVGHNQETGYNVNTNICSSGCITAAFEGIWIFELDIY